MFRIFKFFLFIVIITISFISGESLQASDQKCQIVQLEGSVNLEFPDGSKQEAEVGDYLPEDTIVKTGGDSSAVLTYDAKGENLVQVGANSQIQVVTIKPADLTLKSGQLFAKVKKVGNIKSFKISTPVCVAAVRGTEYSVDHTNDGSQVKVFENQVDVSSVDSAGNIQETTVLNQGSKLSVDLKRRFSKVFNLSGRDKRLKKRFEERMNRINFKKIRAKYPLLRKDGKKKFKERFADRFKERQAKKRAKKAKRKN